MQASLFEDLSRQAKPRLKPNVFARLSRFSFRHPVLVILLWLVVLAGAAFVAGSTFQPPQSISFSTGSAAAQSLEKLRSAFPEIENLQTLQLASDDANLLRAKRDELADALVADKTDFALVATPGAGLFYEQYNIYYQPLSDVDARAAYALSLKPLFDALAEAPTTESLTTLVDNVSAALSQGRDSQGLDILFHEAAAAVNSLMAGADDRVDWPKIAGLTWQSAPKQATVIILPTANHSAIARQRLVATVATINKGGKITAALYGAEPPLAASTVDPVHGQRRIAVAVFLAALGCSLVLLAGLGQLPFVITVAMPALCAAATSAAALAMLSRGGWTSFWPAVLSSGLSALVISLRMNFSAAPTDFHAPAPESTVMLAAQRQGLKLLVLALAGLLPWAGWAALRDGAFAPLIGAEVTGAAVAAISTVMLFSALPKLASARLEWRAAEWIVPLHQALFAHKAWPLLRAIAACLLIGLSLSALILAPRALSVTGRALQKQDTVNMLAPSAKAASKIVGSLKSVPEAGSARWIGAFLPPDITEKNAALLTLKSQFARIAPPQPPDVDTLKEQISGLQDSLVAVVEAATQAPELKSSADDLRQSLESLTTKGTDAQVKAFENRMFGGFNRLGNVADGWATEAAPTLASLDPTLTRLFVARNGTQRIEVMPAEGVTAETLAGILEDRGFAVAAASLVEGRILDTFKAASRVLAYTLAGLGIAYCGLLTRQPAKATSAMASVVIALCTMAAIAGFVPVVPDAKTLMMATLAFAFVLTTAAAGFLRGGHYDDHAHHARHGVELLLPALVMAMIAAAAMVLKLTTPGMDLALMAAALMAGSIMIVLVQKPLIEMLQREGGGQG